MPHPMDARPDNYPILSLPFTALKSEYDVVVVGSGYGAGVAASRMARAGKSVAVLELGWERRPGSFPRTLRQCLRQVAISGARATHGLVGKLPLSGRTKLFQLKLGEGQHTFCAHGLGGGSLINAGVFLEATDSTFEMSPWPAEIRDHPSSMKQYYDRAADMLQPSPYPATHPTPKKLEHMEETARLLGREMHFFRVPLTTFFDDGRNSAGISMRPNLGSGHEATGLNDGSKNSIPVTYLADAWNWGAEIFCGCEVRYIEKAADGHGYIVYFAWHDKGRAAFGESGTQLFWVKTNEFCFLGAGAIGTTEILLRSKRHGLPASPLVGRNMSGNGDILLFGYNGMKEVNAVAGASTVTGPTITGMIDNRQKPSSDPLSGYVIEDGCIPEPFAPLLQIMLATQTLRNDLVSFLWSPYQQTIRTLAALKSALRGPYVEGGAVQRTATYLIMSHDSNELTLSLKDDEPHFVAGAEGRLRNATRITQVIQQVVHLMGGRNREEVSVHVLGGAHMSRNGTGREGVTNHMGQAFTGHGSDVHAGLVCCDASVIPTSLGANPLATITALAERSLSLISKESGFHTDLTTQNGTLDYTSAPRVSRNPVCSKHVSKEKGTYVSTGWQFTELLNGHISVPAKGEFEIAEIEGKRSLSPVSMLLTVDIHKRARGRGPKYKGVCIGTVSCRALSQKTMRVISGELEFFVREEAEVDATKLIYRLHLMSVEGKRYKLTGHKTIDPSAAWSVSRMWRATTTVNVRVATDEAGAIGAGVVRVAPSAFVTQMSSFCLTKGFTFAAALALLLFLLYFAVQISAIFFHPFLPRPAQTPAPPCKPQLPATCVRTLKASDGIEVSVEVYDPVSHLDNASARCPILFLPGILGVRPEHSIFALPYQRCNMAEYFASRGHRCYILSPRWSCDEKVATECTVFDARLDIAAAVQHISLDESRKPYVVAHCQGSVALSMALLDGTVESSQLLGVTANSVFMNQVFGYWNSIKAYSPILIRLYELLDGRYFPIAFSGSRNLFHHALDALLNFYPIPKRRDRCRSAACHRTSFSSGLLWNHENLNRHTHDNIDRFFAGTPTRLLEHVTRMGTYGGCLDKGLHPLITEKNLAHLRGLPILFVSGADNEVFDPETTLRDYELLRRRFGEKLYRRFLVEGYGHLDPILGKNADEDVYWRVLAHVEWCTVNTANDQKGASM
ncbi:FAD/NAD(P)-binding domain-containing protein [Aspergillus carlsbadensis]|nr:FAD/NAD(P)-binding domain-containing protein [Aspergillus carlsbadensis]